MGAGRPARAVAALGRDLQRDLPESYRNRVEVAAGKNDAVHGILSLSPTRYQQGNARAAHAEAIAEVRTMPEEQVARSRAMESRLARLESGNEQLGELSPQTRSGALNMVNRLVSAVA